MAHGNQAQSLCAPTAAQPLQLLLYQELEMKTPMQKPLLLQF